MDANEFVHIECDGSPYSAKVTYKGEVIPAESITWTADARDAVPRAVITVPAFYLDSRLSPDLVQFIVSHAQDPKSED
jgi:hypothetical protein